MKVTTQDEIRSCGNICSNLGARLEMALAVAKPEEEKTVRKLMKQREELSLAIARFDESLSVFKDDVHRSGKSG